MNKSDLGTAVHLAALHTVQLRKEVCDERGMNELAVDFHPTGYGDGFLSWRRRESWAWGKEEVLGIYRECV